MRGFALLCLAGILVACGGPADPPPIPRSPFSDFLPEGLPLVRGESAPAWEREKYPVAVRPEGDGVRVLLGYEPEDGGPRERHLEAGEPVPWPAGLAFEKADEERMGPWYRGARPALLLGAAATTRWQAIPELRDGKTGPYPSLYLAGRREDGSLAAVPLHARTPTGMVSLGYAVVRKDLAGAPDATSEIGALRKGDSLRLWWGAMFRKTHPEPEKLDGDIAVADDEILSGPPPGLVSFARTIRQRSVRIGGQIVVVDTGEEVTFRDVLRITQCGGGDELIAILPDFGGRSVSPVRLPVLEDQDDPLIVGEDSPPARVLCSVPRAGRLRVGRREVEPEFFDRYRATTSEPLQIVMRVDVEAPWRACGPVLSYARRYGCDLLFACHIVDPGLPGRGEIRIPPPGPGAAKIRAPGDRPAGEVLADVMSALRAGATAIDFE